VPNRCLIVAIRFLELDVNRCGVTFYSYAARLLKPQLILAAAGTRWDAAPRAASVPSGREDARPAERADTRAPGSGSGYGPGVAHDTPSWEQICLSTERLCLRTPTPQDAEAMHELFADPVVMHGLNREPVSELDETRAMIERGADGSRTEGLGPFILETATDRRMVGQAGLMIFDTRLEAVDLDKRGKPCSARTRLGPDTGALQATETGPT
jgi:GNAT acetyltransferase-like protein